MSDPPGGGLPEGVRQSCRPPGVDAAGDLAEGEHLERIPREAARETEPGSAEALWRGVKPTTAARHSASAGRRADRTDKTLEAHPATGKGQEGSDEGQRVAP
jgi:hypothetical protein